MRWEAPVTWRSGLKYVLYSVHHLRRIYTEARAKVAASVFFGWGGFIQFLATLAILPRSIWKNWLFGPPNRRDDLCLCFCINPSSMLYTEFLISSMCCRSFVPTIMSSTLNCFLIKHVAATDLETTKTVAVS